jgi:hypothetical protein
MHFGTPHVNKKVNSILSLIHLHAINGAKCSDLSCIDYAASNKLHGHAKLFQATTGKCLICDSAVDTVGFGAAENVDTLPTSATAVLFRQTHLRIICE